MSEICDNDFNRPGVMATVLNLTEEMKLNPESTFPSYSKLEINTALSYLALEKLLDKFSKDGIPGIMGIEITRRILDKEIKESKEFTI